MREQPAPDRAGDAEYANANKGSFPRTIYDGQEPTPTMYTGVDGPNPFAPGGPGPNDVTAAMFLLVRTVDITTEVFTCPIAPTGTAWDLGGKPRDRVSNFPGRQFLGYSICNPYPSHAAAAAGFTWSYLLTSDFAIAADMNPGPPTVVSLKPDAPRRETAQANSPNHLGDGQNVLYADGHVEYQNTPFCGMLRGKTPGATFRDNIYTFGAGFGGAAGVGVSGPPADGLDSVLLPVAPEGPARASAGPGGVPVWLVLLGVGAIIFAEVLWRRLRRKARPAPAGERE